MAKGLAVFLILALCGQTAFGFTVLIDPGHGGDDHGAKNNVVKDGKPSLICEKDLTLQLAQKIYNQLKRVPKVEAYLTRSVDRTVSLEERAHLAEKIKADFFISVHVNASTAKISHGFETYYLDHHKDTTIHKIEELENKNLKGEALVVDQILTDLVIDRTITYSRSLAQNIHGELSKNLKISFKMNDRGVKPGLFYVLAMSKIPGVLLEVGFITNDFELKKLTQDHFQTKYAEAVVKGIQQFAKTYKTKKGTPALL